MVYQSCRSIAQLETELLALLDRLDNRSMGRDSELPLHARLHPGSHRRANRARIYADARFFWQAPQQQGKSNKPANAGGPNIAGRIEEAPGDPGVTIQAALNPDNRAARNQLHLSRGLREERGGLEGALATPNHSDPFSPEC